MKKWMSVPICDPCWEKNRPGRLPVRLIQRVMERCYYCGNAHESGIYVREETEGEKDEQEKKKDSR